jgi:hypothetical protein
LLGWRRTYFQVYPGTGRIHLLATVGLKFQYLVSSWRLSPVLYGIAVFTVSQHCSLLLQGQQESESDMLFIAFAM